MKRFKPRYCVECNTEIVIGKRCPSCLDRLFTRKEYENKKGGEVIATDHRTSSRLFG